MHKKVVFKTDAFEYGQYAHHWVTLKGTHYLSVQSAPNVIKFFAVNCDAKTFTEDESLRITADDFDVIQWLEVDENFENVVWIKNADGGNRNGNILEQRAVMGDHAVTMSMRLEATVQSGKGNFRKQMVLSNDGTMCAVALGLRQ